MSYQKAVGAIPPLFLLLLVISIGYSPMTIADIIKNACRIHRISIYEICHNVIYPIDIYGAM